MDLFSTKLETGPTQPMSDFELIGLLEEERALILRDIEEEDLPQEDAEGALRRAVRLGNYAQALRDGAEEIKDTVRVLAGPLCGRAWLKRHFREEAHLTQLCPPVRVKP